MHSMTAIPSDAARVGDTRHIKYVFVDVVEFSMGRSVEAQNEIVQTLNAACIETFNELIPNGEVIYIPTGDGICVAILDVRAKYDAHLTFAAALIARIDQHNERLATAATKATSYMRRFQIRVGISENVDNIVLDVNGRKNVAGNGVTTAQRVMALADGMQILVSANAYQSLHTHERYLTALRHFKAVIKHGESLDVYQFVQPSTAVSTETPLAFRDREPIEEQLNICLRENPSTAGQVQCVREATESWETEVYHRFNALLGRAPVKQKPVLEKAHRAWTRYIKAELAFSAAFYSRMQGTMWRPIRASRHHELVRERGRDLVTYLELANEQSELNGDPTAPSGG